MKTLVLKTGVANIASVLSGLEKAGGKPSICRSPAEAFDAQRLVVPGVGSFGAAMQALDAAGYAAVLTKRIDEGRPTLAICVGLQILFAASEESPGAEGLQLFPQTVRRFPRGVRVPHFGWNYVSAGEQCALLSSGYAYFANSYRVDETPAGWQGAACDHGGGFVAGLEKGAVLALQFHPELSGDWGIALLSRWLNAGSSTNQRQNPES